MSDVPKFYFITLLLVRVSTLARLAVLFTRGQNYLIPPQFKLLA